jgi:hypothetical protein
VRQRAPPMDDLARRRDTRSGQVLRSAGAAGIREGSGGASRSAPVARRGVPQVLRMASCGQRSTRRQGEKIVPLMRALKRRAVLCCSRLACRFMVYSRPASTGANCRMGLPPRGSVVPTHKTGFHFGPKVLSLGNARTVQFATRVRWCSLPGQIGQKSAQADRATQRALAVTAPPSR